MPTTKTPRSILEALREEYAHLLKQEGPLFEIKHDTQTELDVLARRAGSCGIGEAVGSNWNMPISKFTENLVGCLAMWKAEEAGLGRWNDLGEFLDECQA